MPSSEVQSHPYPHLIFFFKYFFIDFLQVFKKFRIRDTKHLSTNADSSTDTTVGWTKNTPKPK